MQPINPLPPEAPRTSTRSRERVALGVAAAGLAVISPGGAEARHSAVDDVRIPQNAIRATSGDSYQDGRALLAAGDVPGAIAAFRAALVKTPQSVDALNGLAVAYDRMGRYDISRSYYDTALAIDPNAVLVLNNLGYSLYLQGRDEAAMPLLQRAVDSDDAAAQRAARRVLAMISARMREIAIAASAPEAMVAEAPPQARIEVSSSGEQRLVLAAAAPPRALAERLGDAAALVMVEAPATPKRATAGTSAAAPRAAFGVIMDVAAAAAPAAIPARQAGAPIRPAAPAEVPLQLANATPAANRETVAPVPAAIMLAAADTPRQTAPAAQALPPAIVTAGAGASAAGVTAATDAPFDAAVTTVAGVAAAAVAAGADAAGLDTSPAWLVALRRDTAVAGTGKGATLHPVADQGLPRFDSDDRELNAFAARMRGIEPPAPPVSVAEAVARLEALLRRLHTV